MSTYAYDTMLEVALEQFQARRWSKALNASVFSESEPSSHQRTCAINQQRSILITDSRLDYDTHKDYNMFTQGLPIPEFPLDEQVG